MGLREGETHYNKLVTPLNIIFNPQHNCKHYKFIFHRMKQKATISTTFIMNRDNFPQRVDVNAEIKSQIKQDTRKGTYQPEHDPTQGLLQLARTLQLVTSQDQWMTEPHHPAGINHISS